MDHQIYRPCRCATRRQSLRQWLDRPRASYASQKSSPSPTRSIHAGGIPRASAARPRGGGLLAQGVRAPAQHRLRAALTDGRCSGALTPEATLAAGGTVGFRRVGAWPLQTALKRAWTRRRRAGDAGVARPLTRPPRTGVSWPRAKPSASQDAVMLRALSL